MVEINYKCTNCNFSFKDKNLIFYLETNNESPNRADNLEDILNEEINNLKLIETSLNKENSDNMSKSFIAGFLYENYCPHCMELIKTYVPESNELFTDEEIERIIKKELSKSQDSSESNFKILFFDFKNTFYKDRRNILENNICPNCKKEMSLVISEKIPCPQCGEKLEEEF
ncbi:MAG: hypothetical protein IKV87_06795 [Methanobrevibacter sp.]|nr:hypothetical protein [Methanobrevibacter sp.]